MADDDSEPLGEQGRYRLGEPLGRGGTSTVYRARDLVLDRDVAIKVFSARASSPDDVRAQEAEARLLASFAHHNLVTLLDAGVDTGEGGDQQVYLVMELVEGQDLRTRLRHGRLPLADVAHLGFDLATALEYVHDRGVTHRDMKPSNVLLVDHGADQRPRVKLADFGVATFEGRGDDDGEFVTGTAAYLSPEQVDGEDAQPASDVYSLGLVLIEALTGVPAYPGAVVESAFARLEHDPDLPDGLPLQWRAILTGMTARDMAARPTAGEAALAFRQIIVEDKGRGGDDDARDVAARQHNLIGAAPDEVFDRIASLGVRMLGLTTCVISVVEDDRIRFQRHDEGEGARVGELSAGDHVAGLHTRPVFVGDLAVGTASSVDPVLAADAVRCAAVAPLITEQGYTVGAVCVAGPEPRRFTDDDRLTVLDLAGMVVHEMEIRLAVRRIAFPIP
ncbi:protein kinase [uncultured Amnibacterium sp.]|uniref:serine/threonine-protein kinase n=1 Tax=uncultured Amnibacterium sp. TaxID=1631851 RepID=UPI0035CA97BB